MVWMMLFHTELRFNVFIHDVEPLPSDYAKRLAEGSHHWKEEAWPCQQPSWGSRARSGRECVLASGWPIGSCRSPFYKTKHPAANCKN